MLVVVCFDVFVLGFAGFRHCVSPFVYCVDGAVIMVVLVEFGVCFTSSWVFGYRCASGG